MSFKSQPSVSHQCTSFGATVSGELATLREDHTCAEMIFISIRSCHQLCGDLGRELDLFSVYNLDAAISRI
jgi:hypothetical protein